MKTLLELERIATTNGNRTPPASPEPRRKRRRREREQLRNLKRAAVGADIDVNQKRKDFNGFSS